MLVDVGTRFAAGDVIAAPLSVPAGRTVEVYDQQVGYYERIVPILDLFCGYLKASGHADATLRVGEDVCQLDMVACASPHIGARRWLAGLKESEQTVMSNCVSQNAWAIKQLIQSRPAVLLLIGEGYTMFRDAFGRRITAAQPLPDRACRRRVHPAARDH